MGARFFQGGGGGVNSYFIAFLMDNFFTMRRGGVVVSGNLRSRPASEYKDFICR
jgi:hypothetical protein